SCTAFLSNCHGLPKRIWHAAIGSTLQTTSSLYRPMVSGTVTCSLTYCSPVSFNHSNLKGRESGLVSRSSFLTKKSLATLVQLPLSMISEQTFSETRHRE